ncbi:MAG TPA: hypothetical protein VHD56_12250 [Tepidisphaeraceae bacterium]|nr:hypothetical protein [Tepidisphaeraceae bacterium]
MPYRRRSVQSPKITRAAAATCEALEQRQMLTSVIHGLFTNTIVPGTANATVYEGTNVFQYKQANGNATIRISVTGDLTAEFIGAQYNPNAFDGSQVTLTDLVPDTVPNATAGAFLFNIYVLHADANCSISISQINNNDRMTPFGGGIGMRITDAFGGGSVVVTPGDGGAYLGAETLNTLTAPSNSIPLIYSNQRGFGLRPSSAGRILSGLIVTPGNNFDKFFFGGTVTGYVSIGGNIDTFYAGNILTGDASGISQFANTSDYNTQNVLASAFVQRNFHVDGDIQHLISANSFGTLSVNNLGAGATAGNFESVQYKTGFQLDVNGRASDVHADNSFLGEATVHDLTTVTGLGVAQHELEFRGATLANNSAISYFDVRDFGNNISLGELQADARFNNDTFATAQYVGTLRSQQLRDSNVVQLFGSLGNSTTVSSPATNDGVDYYAIGLLAGQTVNIQLLDSVTALFGPDASNHPRLGIFDPNGRLIATDYSDVSQFSRVNKAIQIKASIPGVYRIAVAEFGDLNFNGTADAATGTTPAESVTLFIPSTYELRVTQPGDIALGGLSVNQHIATLDSGAVGIQVLHGDVGAIHAGAQIFSVSNPWYVPAGNLRSMDAVSIGLSNLNSTSFDDESGPDLLIRKGSIGLLRTTGANVAATNANYLSINDDVSIFPTSDDSLDLTSPTIAVGTNIQTVDCAGVLEGDYLANAAIGVIRAQIIGGFHSSSPIIQANVNNVGSDGIIDLIDVTTTSTTVAAVDGLAITTGEGGNVRYFHIQPTAFVNSDPFFGNGLNAERTFAPGTSTTVVDDSGARMVLTPLPRDPNTTFPANPNALSPYLDPPALSILTYPVRDKTGVVLMRVTVTPVDDTTDGLARPGGGGLMVQSSSTNGRATAEISDIDLNRVPPTGIVGAGGFTGGDSFTFQPFTLAPFNRIYTLTDQSTSTNPIRDQNLIFQGSSPIDIWNITAFTTGMNISSISNSTTGEIVNIGGATNGTAGPNIFSMTAENIGVAVSHTGAAVEGGTPITGTAAALPFAVNTPAGAGQRNLINVSNVNSMLARRAIGNVNATNIGTIGANSDGKNIAGVFEGIVGPIVSRGTGSQITGNIVHVAIGEGIASSGSGSFARSGVFADGIIDSVTGSGDIRGDVIALGNTTFVSQAAVDPITGAAIFLADGITQATQRTPTYFLGSIKLNGGSIIDANVEVVASTALAGGTGYTQALEFPVSKIGPTGPSHTAAFPGEFTEMGSIRLDGTGGILGSLFLASNIGSIGINGGFGLINSVVGTVGPGSVGAIATDGYGVRGSTIQTGQNLNSVTARGNGRHTPTSYFSPSVRISESTTIDPFSGQTLDAFNDLDKAMGTTAAKPYNGTNTDVGLIQDSQFTGGGKIGKVDAYRIYARYVMQTDPVTGLTSRISYGSPSYPMRISFAGGAGSVVAHEQVNGLALITGKLDSFAVGGNVQNTAINVGSLISSISAGALLGTTSIKMTAPGGTLKSLTTLHSLFATIVISQDIQSIKVGTDIGSPNIFSGRNVGSIVVSGNVLSGAKIRVAKTLGTLAIGGDVKVNSSITAGAIQKQTIKGQVLGDIIIT